MLQDPATDFELPLPLSLSPHPPYNLFLHQGANRATIYELLPDGHIDVRQVVLPEIDSAN